MTMFMDGKYIFVSIVVTAFAIIIFGLYNDRDSSNEGCNTYLWRVDSNHYLFGTMHVDAWYLWDAVPNIAKKAFYNADEVYFESIVNRKDYIGEAFK